MATKKNVWVSLPMQMMYGLFLGVIVGAVVSADFASTYLQPLGTLFIRLIRMVVVPLVLATLIAGAAGLGSASRVGVIAGKDNSRLYDYFCNCCCIRYFVCKLDGSGTRPEYLRRRFES